MNVTVDALFALPILCMRPDADEFPEAGGSFLDSFQRVCLF